MHHPIEIQRSLEPCQAHRTSLHGVLVVRLGIRANILEILYVTRCRASAFSLNLITQLSGHDGYNKTLNAFYQAIL